MSELQFRLLGRLWFFWPRLRLQQPADGQSIVFFLVLVPVRVRTEFTPASELSE